MLHFNILTLFPELIDSFFKFSILNKAVENNLISFSIFNIRDFSNNKHKVVDDTPFGGGSGMLMKPEPIFNALSSLKNKGRVLVLSAKGTLFNNKKALELSNCRYITIICGRYEGIDERIIDIADEEISIGDYILMGGEIGAGVIIEAVSRYVPSVVGKEESVKIESFSDIFLEYPQYTRPRDFSGKKVPEILFSGNHKKIDTWRKEKQIQATLKKRVDLIYKRERALTPEEVGYIKKLYPESEISIALIHYPVYNKKGEEVATATTNMDIHDIARVAKTYNLNKYYIVTPIKDQVEYIKRVINHWVNGYGYKYNKNRANALSIVDIVEDLDVCIERVKKSCKKELLLIGTSARYNENLITITKLKKLINNYSILLIFGTGWGLSKSIVAQLDYMLEPIYGIKDFNHLPVRSAVSIVLDRLIGI